MFMSRVEKTLPNVTDLLMYTDYLPASSYFYPLEDGHPGGSIQPRATQPNDSTQRLNHASVT
jgi:hypothetical protein